MVPTAVADMLVPPPEPVGRSFRQRRGPIVDPSGLQLSLSSLPAEQTPWETVASGIDPPAGGGSEQVQCHFGLTDAGVSSLEAGHPADQGRSGWQGGFLRILGWLRPELTVDAVLPGRHAAHQLLSSPLCSPRGRPPAASPRRAPGPRRSRPCRA